MELNYPPSLPVEVLKRAHRVSNGELGVARGDVETFLACCDRDNIRILGWELWLVDTEPATEDGSGEAVVRLWGSIPPFALIDGEWPAFFGGCGDLRHTRIEIASLRLSEEIRPERIDQVRFNFTLAV